MYLQLHNVSLKGATPNCTQHFSKRNGRFSYPYDIFPIKLVQLKANLKAFLERTFTCSRPNWAHFVLGR